MVYRNCDTRDIENNKEQSVLLCRKLAIYFAAGSEEQVHCQGETVHRVIADKLCFLTWVTFYIFCRLSLKV